MTGTGVDGFVLPLLFLMSAGFAAFAGLRVYDRFTRPRNVVDLSERRELRESMRRHPAGNNVTLINWRENVRRLPGGLREW